MIPLGPVVARARVRAERQLVWNYLADQGLRAAWWPEVNLDAMLGGSVVERWVDGEGDAAISRDASGTIDVYVEGHALGFRWSDAGDAAATAVLFTLRAQGVDTGVTVTETGFDALPMAAERAAVSTDGWQSLLADLVAAVDAGVGEASGVAVSGAGAVATGAMGDAGAVSDAGAESDAAGSEGSAPAVTVENVTALTENDTVEVDVVEEVPVEVDIVEVDTAASGSSEADALGAENADLNADATGGDDAEAETVEVSVVDAGADETDAAIDPAADRVDDETDVVPLVLPGPPSAEGGNADGADARDDTESITGDPDFDALIRGDSLE